MTYKVKTKQQVALNKFGDHALPRQMHFLQLKLPITAKYLPTLLEQLEACEIFTSQLWVRGKARLT